MEHNPSSLPLYEKIAHKYTVKRAIELAIFFLLLSLLTHRLLYLPNHGVPWLIAFLCESWFTFIWVLTMNAKWNPVEYKTYPENLKLRVCEEELPPVDIFVTTADPILEPPIIVVNTVLSLMALDYPAHKLACYVSDDGGSALTYYSIVEASKFAKLWVPFCKKHGVLVRAPFRHFYAGEGDEKSELCLSTSSSLEFEQERQKMKDEYVKLVQRIEDTTKMSKNYYAFEDEKFKVFADIDHKNHASIIKVIWQNREGSPDGLPHLIYISREKRPKHPHHYKAGAMNVLSRVSGVMTNAPIMLNLDCDMFANNPEIVMHAMCLLLGLSETDSGFVQTPQYFYDGPSDHMMVLQQYLGRGIVGLQGPFYQGTNCFHRRKVIYGSWPEDKDIKDIHPVPDDDERFGLGELQKRFGNSEELTRSAASTLLGSSGWSRFSSNFLSLVDGASKVADCGYEYGTIWGKEIGWLYGSTVEDILTGMNIHSKGWRSVYCTPDRPSFQGCAPSDVLTALTQQKRWATGLLEILFSPHNPFLVMLNGRLQFRECLAYMWLLVWSVRSIFELIYALLPAYCIITNSSFLPKGQALCIPLALFVIYNLNCLSEYLLSGSSARAWWEAQSMGRINSATSWLFGVFAVIFKLLGLSEPIFDITHKGQSASTSSGGFTFSKSPIFIPPTTLSLVHLMALATRLLGFQLLSRDGFGLGIGEVCCSLWVVLCFVTFTEGLFKKGRNGIPASVICKSAALALLFAHFCRWTTLV